MGQAEAPVWGGAGEELGRARPSSAALGSRHSLSQCRRGDSRGEGCTLWGHKHVCVQ